jgi:hypothetical protein
MSIAFLALVSTVTVSCGLLQGDLNGEVFIVTEGGQSIKLGLVEVRAIPEQDARDFVAKKREIAAARQSKLEPGLGSARREWEAAQAVVMEQSSKARLVFKAYLADIMSRTKKRAYEEASAREAEARKVAAAKSSILEPLAAEYSWFNSSEYYFEGLPPGTVTCKTNADGEFTLRLRKGAKHALAAKARRKVIDDEETYFWFVWVSLDGKATRTLLSNDNLLPSGGTQSVVNLLEPLGPRR